MPPVDAIDLGQSRARIQRTMSSMWIAMSPVMPLPYSMNARHQRRCGSGAPRSLYSGGAYGRIGAGPGPHLVVEKAGTLLAAGILVVPHGVVTVDLDQADLAELPLLDDPVASLDEVWRAPALRADLHDALVLARGGDHRLALDNIDADRLLHVDVGAGLAGSNHR